MKYISRVWLLFVLLMFSMFHPSYSAQVNFKGKLRSSPPCTITGPNNPISIDFGDVGITLINGKNYKQPFTLVVTCDSSLGSDVTLYLGYDGMNASFDSRALQTSREGLGIMLYQDNPTNDIVEPDKSNHKIVVSGGTPVSVKLAAVPVKNPDPALVLYEGPFTAIATVEIRYP